MERREVAEMLAAQDRLTVRVPKVEQECDGCGDPAEQEVAEGYFCAACLSDEEPGIWGARMRANYARARQAAGRAP